MQVQQIKSLVKDYYEKYEINVVSIGNIIYYPTFHNVEGSVWLVKGIMPKSTLEESDDVEFIVSEKSEKVEFIINSSGFTKYPHLNVK